jgi:hypothetical protein
MDHPLLNTIYEWILFFGLRLYQLVTFSCWENMCMRVISKLLWYHRTNFTLDTNNTPTPGYNFSKNLQDTRDESNTQLAIRTGRKRVRRVWILQCKRTCSNTFQRTVCRCDLWWNVTENCYVVILLQRKMWENISSSLAP